MVEKSWFLGKNTVFQTFRYSKLYRLFSLILSKTINFGSFLTIFRCFSVFFGVFEIPGPSKPWKLINLRLKSLCNLWKMSKSSKMTKIAKITVFGVFDSFCMFINCMPILSLKMFEKHCFCMFLMSRGRKNTILGQKTWFLGPKTDFWVKFLDFLNRCYSFTTYNCPWYAKNVKNRQKPEKTRFLGQKTCFSCQKHGFRVKTDQN